MNGFWNDLVLQPGTTPAGNPGLVAGRETVRSTQYSALHSGRSEVSAVFIGFASWTRLSSLLFGGFLKQLRPGLADDSLVPLPDLLRPIGDLAEMFGPRSSRVFARDL